METTDTYGTLDYQKVKYETYEITGHWQDYEDFLWVVNGFQVKQMAKRIFQEKVLLDSDDKNAESLENAFLIRDNIYNIKLLNWLMTLYPLDIKKKEIWKERLGELAKQKERKREITTLQQINPPSSFKGQLLEFQKEGLDFLLKTNGNALLADEMGLGKTVESLAFIATKKDALPALVITPLSVLYHWQNEIGKFLETKATSGMFKGSAMIPRITMIRSGKPSQIHDADIYLINYELVYKRRHDLEKINFHTIIFDEIQNLRRIESYKYQASYELAQKPSVKYRLGLSGTPIYNRGSEMWAIIDTLSKGLLGTYREFVNTYCQDNLDGRYVFTNEGGKALSELLAENVMIRRRKKDVLKDLPDKVVYKQPLQINKDYYEDELRKLFEEIEKKKNAIYEDKENKHKTFELESLYERALNNERQIAGMAKAPHAIEYIKDIMEIDEKVVVFCHHLVMHEILMNGLSQFNPRHIIGGQKLDERQEQINDFQNKDEYKLMIAGLRAGSLGISLTSASYVIFAELDWSPSVHKQAEDRLHRINQKNTVFSHYLVGMGTLDEYLIELLTAKSLVIDSILGDQTQHTDVKKAEQILYELQQRIMGKKYK